jgi:hypothetical protein
MVAGINGRQHPQSQQHNNILHHGAGKKGNWLLVCAAIKMVWDGARGLFTIMTWGGGTTEQHGGALGFAFFLFLSFPLVPAVAMAAELPSGACIGSSGRCSSRKGLLLCPFLSSLD